MNHLEVLGWGPRICISDKFLGWGWCCWASHLRTTVILYMCGWLRWGIWQHECGYKLTLTGFFRKSYDLIHCDSEVVTSYVCIFIWFFIPLIRLLGHNFRLQRGFYYFFFFLNIVVRKKTSGKLTPDWKKQHIFCWGWMLYFQHL